MEGCKESEEHTVRIFLFDLSKRGIDKNENFIYSINVTLPILVMVLGYFLKQIGMLDDNFVMVAISNLRLRCLLLFRDILRWI